MLKRKEPRTHPGFGRTRAQGYGGLLHDDQQPNGLRLRPFRKLEAAGYPDGADAFASDTCGSKRLIASNAVTYSPESHNSK